MWISIHYMTEKRQQDVCTLIHPFSRLCMPRGNPECHSFTLQHFRSQACTVAYACDPSTWEAKAGGHWSLTAVWATGWFQAIVRCGVRSCLTWMTPPRAWPSLGLVSILVQVVRYALTEQETLETARSWGNVFSTKLVRTKSEKGRKEGRKKRRKEASKQGSLRSQRDLHCFAERWNTEAFPILENL